MSGNKIITRIRGGLGNQLFCYAAARRLALVNSAELVIDDVTGFARDRQYRRKYALDHFHISAKKATSSERMEPFERYRRGFVKLVSRYKPYADRSYLVQEGRDFDKRLLMLKVNGTLYLDGLWQSEDYFKDIDQQIREDLRILPPLDESNLQIAYKISKSTSVALHVRWFDSPGGIKNNNISVDYYKKAIDLIEKNIESPHYFLFSDNPVAASEKLALPEERYSIVSRNHGDENAYADLWLMAKCMHFITANSTFSWWGAWLGSEASKIVITPHFVIDGIGAWGFKGLIPDHWLKV